MQVVFESTGELGRRADEEVGELLGLVGGERRFVLGKHTGRRALEHIAKAHGFDLSDAEVRWVLEQVKQKSEGKCSVTPEVLCGLLRQAKEEVLP